MRCGTLPAPARWPRTLVAGVIGGLIAYGLASRLAPLGATVEMAVDGKAGASVTEWNGAASPGRIGVTLRYAFVACGAIAGLVCGLAANLLGLTMQPEYPAPEAIASSGRGRLRWPTPPARLQRGFLSPPMIRIVALFAELGPAVGWAIFIPLYLVLQPNDRA